MVSKFRYWSAEARALEAATALEDKNGQTLQLEGRVVELSKQLVSLSREVRAFYGLFPYNP